MKYHFIAGEKQRLLELISQNIGGLSLPAIKSLFKQGEIKLNGVKQRTDTIINIGDEVSLFVAAKYLTKKPLVIIYSDENIVVVDKPCGMDTENNLLSLVNEQFDSARAVHRLDRNTNGLVLFALNDTSEAELKKAIKNRTIQKYYHALVEGVFDREGEKTAYLKKDSNAGFVKISDKYQQGYQKIITHFSLIKAYENDTSLVEVRLITGKTHQIRAHLSHIGFGVIGDTKYNKPHKDYKHQQLTAYKIVLSGLKSPLEYLNNKIFIL